MSAETNPPTQEQLDARIFKPAQYFTQKIVAKIGMEIVEYSERNKIPSNEVHVDMLVYHAGNKINFRLEHKANGVRIVGSPMRVFSIEMKF